MQHANDVGQVVQLMLGEELVVQVEAAEHHVHLRHVVLVGCMKRVVQAGEVRPRGVNQAQVVQAAGAGMCGSRSWKNSRSPLPSKITIGILWGLRAGRRAAQGPG